MNRVRLTAMTRRLPDSVHALVRAFHERGFEIYLVGGAVRNLLLGHKPSDFDFTTNATPEQMIDSFRRVIPTGVQHGTVTILHRRESFEVTTYRTEGAYSDARRPDEVSFVSDINEDLRRRDFTINAMALDPVAERFLDPHGGEDDLEGRVVRAIGDPDERFSEDALRMLRAIRFASQLSFRVDEPTLASITRRASTISAVSLERVRDELTKLVLSPLPSYGFRLLEQTGLLGIIVPELAEGVGVEQRGNHRFDVFEHSLRACDAAPGDRLELRLAALLHDVGKPRTLVIGDDGERRFHGHDQESARMTESLLRRLRYPNRVVNSVSHLVRHHMFNYTPEWSDAAVRRFVARVGADSVQDLIALRAADGAAVRGEHIDTRALGGFSERVRRVMEEQSAVTVRDLAVNGRDLMNAGIPGGPGIGVVLNALLETVLDDPSQNSKERLIEIGTRFYEERVREQ
ncbi:MAG: CCA tRNA nucleotidyltransferase [Spirochaetota bacterium]